jgi:hypothetical protein
MVLTYNRKQLLPEKKWYSRLAGHVIWRVQITTGKNYHPKKKKVQSSARWLKSMFFGGFKLQPEKITSRKKRYSCLADGRNKSQMTICRVKIRTPIITKLEKITTGEKKGTVVWSSVGAQNTKYNTHRHNNQQDELCHPTLQWLCPLSLHG